jgi:tetratricopeptide (TPR) repeat protein
MRYGRFVANIELHERLLGGGFHGTIDMPAMPPALSWADSQALQTSAAGAMAAAVELRFLNIKLATLSASIAELEQELCLRLDAQTDVLASQLDVLARIESALRRPGQVRAAERIANTAELLRRGRYERALSDAELAIEDDPVNPAGFVAAGWAAIGLGHGDQARKFLLEAGEASDGDQRATALRQAARITFAIEDGVAALAVLSGCDDRTTAFQRSAIEYDRAVYLAASNDRAGAIEALRRVLTADERFAPMVFADSVLSQDSDLREIAATVIRRLTQALATARGTLQRDLEATQTALKSCKGPATTRWLESRDRMLREVTDLRRASRETSEHEMLRDRVSALERLGRRASTLRETAAAWPAAALRAYEYERASVARRQESERTAADTAVAAAAARLGVQLEDEARRFAGQRTAVPKKKPDGSWVITREKRFGNNEAWRARLTNGRSSIEPIPWNRRHDWD